MALIRFKKLLFTKIIPAFWLQDSRIRYMYTFSSYINCQLTVCLMNPSAAIIWFKLPAWILFELFGLVFKLSANSTNIPSLKSYSRVPHSLLRNSSKTPNIVMFYHYCKIIDVFAIIFPKCRKELVIDEFRIKLIENYKGWKNT